MIKINSNVLALPAVYCRRDGAPVLDRLRTERQACVDFLSKTLQEVDAAKRDLSETEIESLERQKKRIGELDSQIGPLAEFEQLRAASDASLRSFSQTHPEHTAQGGEQQGEPKPLGVKITERAHKYRTRGEVIVDLIAQRTGQFGAASGSVMITDDRKRAARDRLMRAGVNFPGAPQEYLQRIVNETTTNLPGLLPEPIVGPISNDLDAVRPFVQSIGARDLGGIPGETFSRPIVTQHTQVGKQATQKSELPSRQYTVGKVPFTKETYGGALDVARQVIDWTSPAAWDALLEDLQAVYGIETENVAADAFAAAITQTVAAPATDDLKGWTRSIYAAAAAGYTGAKRMPNHIWVSLDMWEEMGSIVDVAKRTLRRSDSDGSSSPTSFEGAVLDLPRTVVPSFPAGTIIIGRTDLTEFYEERIGLLSAVEPRLLGVEIAYGGYVAYGTIRPLAFAKITPPA